MKLTKKINYKPYLFLLPAYLLIIIFKYIPFFRAIEKSFFKWNGGKLNQFIGLQNYFKIFEEPTFYESLKNGLYVMIIYIAITVTLPLLGAVLTFRLKSDKSQYLYRTLFILPMIVPMMVTILVWKWIYAGDYGILNQLLGVIGLESLQQPWLGQTSTSLTSILFIGFPWIGAATIGGLQYLVYFGGLQNISGDLFEVAQIDGVNSIKRFFYIELPLVKSQMKLLISLSIISSLQIFNQIFVLTKGGPGNSTMVPSVYMYQEAFIFGKLGYSSALGVVLFIIILLLTVMSQKFLKDNEKID